MQELKGEFVGVRYDYRIRAVSRDGVVVWWQIGANKFVEGENGVTGYADYDKALKAYSKILNSMLENDDIGQIGLMAYRVRTERLDI